jgi:dTDP-4-dehydrorhamnose reductase
MKILLTGKTGQVGYELEGSLQGLGTVIALDRNQMDLANLRQVRDVVRAVQPDLIINPAAYTAVDKAESEPELAMRINGDAPGVMAEEARKLGAAIIHYSTDYIFDGAKRGSQGELVPYTEDDLPNPLNIYGKSKLAGEKAISASGCPHLILRTSWVYGMRGNNFLLTILRLANERDELFIVNDQYGAPTWSRTISDMTSRIVLQMSTSKEKAKWWDEHSGMYNLASKGSTTWYGFAQEIVSHARYLGLPSNKDLRVSAIPSEDYPTPAIRPANSILNGERLSRAFNIICPYWTDSLSECFLSLER